MKYAVYVPNFGPFGNARVLAELARDAEDAGWDGFFVWDHIMWTLPRNRPTVDPWVALGAVAMLTERVRLGALVTPVARRRPWKLAREIVTLDHMSGGRAVLGVGSGHDMFKEYSAFGEPTGQALYAEKLDEGLEVIKGLWSGQPFSYEGRHYHIKEAEFLPAPLQQPRIPVWVAGMWPYKKPFQRAARWDGAVPIGTTRYLTPDDIRTIKNYMMEYRTTDEPLEIVCSGKPLKPDPDGADKAAAFEQAGGTWWLETLDELLESPLEEAQALVRSGPPAS